MNEANKRAALRHAAQLTAKVAARNLANKTTLETVPKVLAALAPFVGQKVCLATGGLSAKLRAALEPFTLNTVPVSIWVSAGHVLRLHVKTCVSGEHCCSYMENTAYLGDLDAGNLSKLFEFSPEKDYRADFTEADVLAMREELKTARNAFERSRDRLCNTGFGEHDAF